MYSKRVDLHGLTESEAIMEIIGALMDFEFGTGVEEIEFITGRGHVLGGVLMDYLEENDYDYYQTPGNSGSYVVKSPF